MKLLRVPGVVAGLLVPLLLLSGCGDDDSTTAADPVASTTSEPPSETTSETPSETTSETPTVEPLPDWPACAEIWQADSTLPDVYAGCLEGETAVPADGRECAFGRPLITYAGSYYAITDGRINETAGAVTADPTFQAALSSCQG